jgi:hypothetical protein
MSHTASNNNDQQNTATAGSFTAANRQNNNINTRLQKECRARVRAEAKLQQLQSAFTVLAKRTEHEAKEHYAAEYAELLALEAAELRIDACKAARVEAERKLKAEQDTAVLLKSRAEADRNAWQLQEQTNILLRKAVQKAQERLATEVMARQAAAFKLKTERELAVIAEQRAYAELKSAHQVELKHRAETIELAASNEQLSVLQQGRLMTDHKIDNEARSIAEAINKFNDSTVQSRCDGDNAGIRTLN